MEEKGRRYILSAETSKLQKAFRDASKFINETTKDLKRLSKASKFDPHSVNGLTETQIRLQRNISKSIEKLEVLKELLKRATVSGDEKEIRKLKLLIASCEADTKKFKSELESVNDKLKSLSTSSKLEVLEKQLVQSRNNAEKLNSALKFDVTNLEASKHKFGELDRQLKLTYEKLELLKKEFNNIDPKIHPEKFRELNSEIIKTKSETKMLEAEMKKLGGITFNKNIVELSRVDKELSKTRENVKKLGDLINTTSNKKLFKDLHFDEIRRDIALSTEKIKMMNAELKKINVNHNRSEFIKLKTEIVETENHVKKLTASVGVLNSYKLSGVKGAFNSLSHSLASNEERMRNFGRNFTLAYSLPVAYGATRVLNSFRETDDGLRRVAAATDEASTNFAYAFKQMENSAKTASKGSVYSMREVASGMEALVKAGWSAKDSQEQVTRVMNLAKVEGMDLARATEIVADGISAFGLKAKDTARFTDVLTQASVDSTTGITEMGETLKYVGPIAGALGFSIEDTAIAMSIMANNGIKASIAGTSLRGGLANLVKPSKQASNALKEIGFSMTDLNGNVKPLSQIIAELREKTKGMTKAQKEAFTTTVFGKTAMSGWMAILESSQDKVDNLTNSINNSSGATERMAKNITDGIGGSFDRFKSSVSNASYEIGKSWEGVISSVLSGSTSLLDGLSSSSDGMKRFVSGTVALTAAIPPLTWGLTSAKKQFLTFGRALTNPWVAGITGAIAFAGALKALDDAYDPVKIAQRNLTTSNEKLGESFKKMTSDISKAREDMKALGSFTENIYGKDVYKQKGQEIITNIKDTMSKISEIRLRALGENRELNNSERSLLSTHIEAIKKLNNEWEVNERQNKTTLNNIVDGFIKNNKTYNKEYERVETTLLNDIKEKRKQAEEEAFNWLQRETQINETRVGNEKKTSEEIQKEYEKRKTDAVKKYDEMQLALERHHLNISGENNKFIDIFKTYNDKKAQIEEEYNKKQKAIDENKFMDATRRNILMGQIEAEQIENKRKLKDETIKILENMNSDAKAKYFEALGILQKHGANMTEEERNQIQLFNEVLSDLPEDVRKTFEEAMQKAGVEIENGKITLPPKADELGGYAMDGLTQGLTNGTPESTEAMQKAMNELLGVVDDTNITPGGEKIMRGFENGINTNNVEGNMNALIKSGIISPASSTNLNAEGRNITQTLASGVKQNDGALWNASYQTANHGRNAASSVSFVGVGSGMVSGISSGLWRASGSLFYSLRSLASSALSAAKSALGINSPSRVFRDEIGHWIPQGISEGIRFGSSNVDNTLNNVLKNTVKKASEFNISDKLKNVVDFGVDYSANLSMQHSMNSNNKVVDTLNLVVDRLNNLELRSDVYLDGDKVGDVTYKRHQVIDRRYGL